MRKKITALANHPFIQGGIILSFSNVITGFLNYLFNSLSAKTLGPAGYGEITALFSYLVVFSVPFGVISADLIRRIGRLKSHQNSTILGWENWIWKKINQWKILIIPYSLVTLIIPRITNLSLFSSIALLIFILLTFIGTFYNATIQGLQLFSIAAALSIVSVLLKLIGPLLVSLNFGGVNLVIAVLVIGSFILLPVYQIIIRKKLLNDQKKYIPQVPLNKRIRSLFVNRNMVITTLSLLAITLFNNFDMMFAKKFFTSEMAGLYGAWNLLAKIVLYAGGPLGGLSFIFFSNQSYKKQHKLSLLLITLGVFFVGIIMLVTYSLFGKLIVSLLFNKNYFVIVNFLPQAAIFGCLYSLINIINGFFLASNSRYSLIIAFLFPFYFISLILFGRSFSGLINLNLFFIATTFIFYTIALFQVPSFQESK